MRTTPGWVILFIVAATSALLVEAKQETEQRKQGHRDVECKRKRCRNARDCDKVKECCLRTTHSHTGHTESYCVLKPKENRPCDPHLKYTCACVDELVCSRQGAKQQDDGVDDDSCTPVPQLSTDRDGFVCVKPLSSLEEGGLFLQNQEEPTDSVLVIDPFTTEPPIIAKPSQPAREKPDTLKPTTEVTKASQTTEPPTVRVFTADNVIAQGGGGTCTWTIGAISSCSSTCEGMQTRDVFCVCTLSNGDDVRATQDNCDRDEPRDKPQTQRSCGVECPVITSPPPSEPTATAQATAAPPAQPATKAPPTAGKSIQPTMKEPKTSTPTTDDAIATTTGGTTEQPSDIVLTVDNVIAQGGGGTCRWIAGAYSSCSVTCEGIQTRDVSCSCTLTDGDTAKATEDNCDRDDLRVRPISQRGCNPECPKPTTAPPPVATTTQPTVAQLPPTVATTTQPTVTQQLPTTEKPITPEPIAREPRECNISKCHDAGDCYDNECCLQVIVNHVSDFYCLPLLDMDEACDLEANWTCSCGIGLECRDDTKMKSTNKGHSDKDPHGGPHSGPHSGPNRGPRAGPLMHGPKPKPSSKKHDKYSEYRQRLEIKKNDKCPSLYHKKPMRPKDHKAACAPATTLRVTPSPSCGRERPVISQPPPTSSSDPCVVWPCTTDCDCYNGSCCLEAEYQKERSKTLLIINTCISQVLEGGVCDPTETWTCPCKSGLSCKDRPTHDHDHRHYRPKLKLKNGNECLTPEIPKKRKHGMHHMSTCQQIGY